MVQRGEADRERVMNTAKGEYKVVYVDQFQPREFSAIIGADICAVRAEFPLLLPLPLLSLSWLSVNGVVRPPHMKALAPPSRAGLPHCLISG